MRSLLCWTALVCISPAMADAATLKPVAVEQFFITPGESSVLRWEIEGGTIEAPLEYALRDYADKASSTGRATITAGRTVEVSVRLAQGYYEVEFPLTRQRFGVVSIPVWQGTRDQFFAIDGALSWLVRDDRTRLSLVKAARRTGIGMVRERLSWASVNPRDGEWDWENGVRYATLRRMYAEQGVEVLEMAHDAPNWPGKVAKYPRDLVATARSWREIGRHWRSTWGALEIWNEPDIFFGGDLPADQYAALAKAIAYAMNEDLPGKPRVPLVGGVMAHCNEPFLRTIAENGLLGSLDVFSFHTYGSAMEMEPLVGRYRAWLEHSGAAGMPLWLTECGRPWRRGPARPPADQDNPSAVDITMKAVEARACGVARYFAFVYPYYEENENNFGMMGREATPLRSMAAYAQLTRAIAGLDYLGDLRVTDKAIKRARVFGDDQIAVAVLYTGPAGTAVAVKLHVPVVRVEGIDGRPIPLGADGTAPVRDGLVYVWLDRRGASLQPAESSAAALDSRTTAMRLRESARKPSPRAAFSPIVMRLELDGDSLRGCSAGYRVKSPPPDRLSMTVRVFNLGPKAEELDCRLSLTGDGLRLSDPASRRVAVPALGAAEVAWNAEAGKAIDKPVAFQVTARNNKGETVSRLAWAVIPNR